MKIFLLVQVIILLISAVISDTKTYKIKNEIVLPFIILGTLSNSIKFGIEGFASSILGIAIPFICLLILFALRMLGAGDIKLLSALGAILGYPFIIYIMAYSFISGGVIAMIIIILRKNALERIKYIVDYLRQCMLLQNILPYSDFTNKSDKGKFRFSYAILVGALISLLVEANIF
jgi:prepilin peptidase CpaA